MAKLVLKLCMLVFGFIVRTIATASQFQQWLKSVGVAASFTIWTGIWLIKVVAQKGVRLI